MAYLKVFIFLSLQAPLFEKSSSKKLGDDDYSSTTHSDGPRDVTDLSDIFKDHYRKVIYTEDKVHVPCYGNLLETVRPGQKLVRTPILTLTGCRLPNDTLTSQLRRLNVDLTNLKVLHLSNVYPLYSKNFQYLSIRELTLEFNSQNRPIFELFDTLANLTTLELHNYLLQPLPSWSKIVNMTLKNVGLSSLSLGLGECSELVMLDMELSILQDRNISLLKNCSKLAHLHVLGHNVTQSRLEALSSGVTTLRKLALSGPVLANFTTPFSESKELKSLSLLNNNMSYFNLSSYPTLEQLILIDNHLTNKSMVIIRNLMSSKRLRVVNINFNRGLDFCEDYDTGVTLEHSSLQALSVADTNTKRLCFSLLTSLEYLDLFHCNISELKFRDLPHSRAPFLKVYLSYNPLRIVSFDEEDYNRLHEAHENSTNNASISVILDDMAVECDCQHAWLARALRERSLSITSVHCVDGTALEETLAHDLECDKYNCEKCTCRRAWSDGWTVADCRELNLLSMPSITSIHELQAGGNSIPKINSTFLVNSFLVRLNLSYNDISYLDEKEAAALFESDRLVWLAGNPIICDCDNRPLLEALQAHSSQVVDYPLVLCVGTGQPVRNVSVGSLCAGRRGEQWPALLGGGGALVALAALAGALYLRYGRVLQVFLYARGWCLCCLREDELDADRIYDAFVSFSHHDEAFVVNELVAGLESAHDYRLCVHFRDWMAGEWIPEQIARSIEQSRRTVIVLSKSYLESTWGLLEFRMAHASAMEEGRARIIVVVLDEVVEDERLDAELRGYLRTNTYVRWGDRWFWEKLQYAMPRGALRGRERIINNLPTNFEMSAA